MAPQDIVIVGAGFSAAALVIHLLKRGFPASHLTVIGHGLLGAGNAYGCNSDVFRLNIREDLPIIFSEDPLHFARWAKVHVDDHDAKTHAGYFYLRRDFAKYINQLIQEYDPQRQLRQIPANVINIQQNQTLWQLALDTGESVLAKNLVLATGNMPPKWPCPIHINANKTSEKLAAYSLVENPWSGEWVQTINQTDDIILLGGGLTALDTISALENIHHRGKIYIVSPRGKLPPEQATWIRSQKPLWPSQLTPRTLVRFMRSYLPDASVHSVEWQCAWEELRPQLNEIWQGFSAQQRAKLSKRLGWLWSLYRFRASPQSIAAFQKLKQQIDIQIGRVKEVQVNDDDISVNLNNGTRITGHWVINCTGVGVDGLAENLIINKIAIADALGISIAVNQHFEVLRTTSTSWDNLFLLGPGTMGSLGDVVAASAIAAQAERLSLQLKTRGQRASMDRPLSA